MRNLNLDSKMVAGSTVKPASRNTALPTPSNSIKSIASSRSFQGATSPHNQLWRSVYLHYVSALIGYSVTLASIFTQLAINGPPPLGFFTTLHVSPGATPLFMVAFFAIAQVISLFAHAIMSADADIRIVARLGTILSFYLGLLYSVLALNLFYHNAAMNALQEAAVISMFFLTLAACSGRGIRYAVTFLCVYGASALLLSLVQDGGFAAGDLPVRLALGSATNWLVVIEVLYITARGLLIWAALYDCQVVHACGPIERWWYRVLIIVNLGLNFSLLASSSVATHQGTDAQVLFEFFVGAVQYTATPLMLVHFMALSSRKQYDMAMQLERARRASIAAEAKAEARQEFLRYIFHEVRVPFNSIKLGLETLSAETSHHDEAALLADLMALQQASESMQRILNDTLDFEKINSGTYRLEMHRTNLAGMLKRVVHDMQMWAKAWGVHVTLEMGPGLPAFVHADGNRLAQVLCNLVSNAIKFSPHDGTGAARVAAKVVPAPASTPVSVRGVSTPKTGQSPHAQRLVAEDTDQVMALHEPRPSCCNRHFVRLLVKSDRLLLQCNAALSDAWYRVEHRCVQFLYNSCHICIVRAARAQCAPAIAIASAISPAIASSSAREGSSKGTTPQITPQATSGAAAAIAASTIWVEFSVTDNGCGINAEDQSKLFQVFAQIAAGQLQAGKGSGLGLYICDQIVARHGGHITVVSSVGTGAKFAVTIPLQLSNDSPVHTPLLESKSCPPVASTLQLSLLIVDDTAATRTFLTKALRRQLPGIVIEDASDGSHAVDMVQRKFFDGIIMDKEMPVMGGCEATLRIRELGFTGFIISVTGDSASDAAVMLENGADATLQKPVNVKELVHLIVHRFACLPDFVPRSSPPGAAKEGASGC